LSTDLQKYNEKKAAITLLFRNLLIKQPRHYYFNDVMY
ncbi:MAG: hypothetical protein ACI9U5_001964, partial [Colwellia sp.]